MKAREKLIQNLWFTCLLLGNAALAEPDKAIIAGNVMIRPEAAEKIIRATIASELKGSFLDANLEFTTEAIEQDIPIHEPKGDLKQILAILGMQDPMRVSVAPIKVGITLPNSGLKLDIRNLQPNLFSVKARWSVTNVSAASPELRMKVKKGLFDRDFEIVSSPVEIGLAKNSPAITIDLSLTAEVLEEGTRIHLQSLKTNLTSQKNPLLFLRLGKLTVDKKPLELDIIGTKTLHADEPSIRAQFQQLEPVVSATIREKLTATLEARFNEQAAIIEKGPPTKIKLDLNDVIAKQPDQPVLKSLLKDTTAEFLISYLQFIGKMNVFSAQIASHICFADQCLYNTGAPSPIATNDLDLIRKSDDAGFIVYESWLQNVIHSDVIQERLKNYYLSQRKNEGSSLGKDGVRLHFSPERHAIVVVLNLEIDIRKSANSDSSFGKKLKLWAASQLELLRGSGKVVKIPIEITGNFKGVIQKPDGTYALKFTTQLPFTGDDDVINTYQYPDNLDDMVSFVRTGLLKDVEGEIRQSVPESIEIPIGKGIEVPHARFMPTNLVITPNHGLMLTGELKD